MFVEYGYSGRSLWSSVKFGVLPQNPITSQRGKSSRGGQKYLRRVWDNAILESTARKWFFRFKEGRFDINDTERSGRPSGFDEDRLNTLIHNDRRNNTFADFRKMKNDIALYVDSFSSNIVNVRIDLQEELIDCQADVITKHKCKDWTGADFFKTMCKAK
ncbi:hypothetical protein ANN_19413 [Periplaneta americana]|uniref:Uncharacterized protein n=1 Tax=Periplaneta americana TaxID=6978 RepID=A0ABQ8SAT3_PERAM|nr:hypothetical protein ANN_19413 [Periplaneta americana]